jgi:hypothetical protein
MVYPTYNRIARTGLSLLLSTLLGGTLLFASPATAQDRGRDDKGDEKKREFRRPWEERQGKGRIPRQITPEMKARFDALPPQERKAIEALRRMITVGLTRAFIAREVEVSAKGGEREQWVHWNPGKGMRRESIRPAGGIFLDNFRRAYMFDPKSKQWYERDSVLPKPQGRISDVIFRLYKGELKATLDGTDKVAGRETEIVRVSPPTGVKGIVRRFWVDKATGMRLRSEEIGEDGRLNSSSYILSIDLTPKFRAEDFEPPANPIAFSHGKKTTYATVEEAVKAGVKVLKPEYLPPGFSLGVIEVHGDGERLRVVQRYRNGITVISLERTRLENTPAKFQERLATRKSAFIDDLGTGSWKAYIWREGDDAFILFGSLSEDQMERIAKSLR